MLIAFIFIFVIEGYTLFGMPRKTYWVALQ